MSRAHIVYTPRPDATPEAELNALAAVYKFVLFDSQDSQARRGDQHDLTNGSTAGMVKKRTTEQTEKEKT